MTELLEKIATGTFGATEAKCPFSDTAGEPVDPEDEDLLKDDRASVTAAQSNDGGKLGANLIAAQHSASPNTYNDIPRKAPDFEDHPRDTHRGATRKFLSVPFTQVFRSSDVASVTHIHPYHSSAHHLIPGNASLHSSKLYKTYMEEGATVTIRIDGAEVTWTIKYHIGYNVNGSHNGVWLPNNYAIQQTGTPTGLKWSEYTAASVGSDQRKWIVAYIAASTKWKGRQFHDAHTSYNRNVKKWMNELCTKLMEHQVVCKECKEKANQEILPPYKVKLRLYAISRVLRTYTMGSPHSWRRGYLTSDQFRRIMSNPEEWAFFQEAYNEADKEP